MRNFLARTLIPQNILRLFCLIFALNTLEGVAQSNETVKQKYDSLLAEMNYYVETYPDSGRQLSEEILQWATKTNYNYGIAYSLNNIGESYYWKRNYDTAGIYYLKAFSRVKNQRKSFLYALTIGNYAEIVDKRGNKDSAFIYHKISLNIFKELKNYRYASMKNLHLALCEWRRGENVEALNYYFAALENKKEIGDPKIVSAILNNMGVVYWRTGNYEKAIEAYSEALSLRESIGYIKGIVITSNNIGLVFLKLNNFESALEKFQTALKVAKQNNFLFGIGYSSLNIADWNLKKKNYKEAIPFAQEAINAYYSYRELNSVSMAMNFLGQAYFGLKKYDLAMKTFNAALDTSKKVNDRHSRLVTLQNIAQVFIEQNNSAEAIKRLFEAQRYAEFEKGRDLLLENYKLLSKVFELSGDIIRAFEYEKKYSQLKDSLSFNELGNRLAAWNVSYEMKKQAEENLQLKSEKEFAALKLDNLEIRQRILIFVIAIVSIFGIALGVLLLYIRKISRQLLLKQLNLERKNKQLIEAKMSAEREKEKALLASRQKSELISIVTHDLKNPLTSIRGATQTILEISDDPNVAKEMLPLILESSNNMLSMINQLLENSRRESALLSINKRNHSIVELCAQIISVNRAQADKKRQQIFFFNKLDDNVILHIDKQKITSAIDNLISNAIKYSPINSKIEVTISLEDSKVRISFKDEGPGLTEEDKQKVFGKFQKLSANPTGGESSTGLGLSIVKQIIELHHGKVWVESELGKGSEFIFELPIIKSTAFVEQD